MQGIHWVESAEWFRLEAGERLTKACMIPKHDLEEGTTEGNFPDARPYLEELAGLSDIITRHHDGDLVERAVRIALEMDHPIYDCLYLACAESTDSDLTTADKPS